MALGEIEHEIQGAWSISRFGDDVPAPAGRSYGAHDKACSAACNALREALSGEGEFYPKSYIDAKNR